jgi:hypothetical protein
MTSILTAAVLISGFSTLVIVGVTVNTLRLRAKTNGTIKPLEVNIVRADGAKIRVSGPTRKTTEELVEKIQSCTPETQVESVRYGVMSQAS